ncbi:MAG: glycosyltransferase family 1 protein [Nostocaceae cyanobacterium]|nr:glycosyltransferase family 1 protein [Nostocaceae cyanobacterium]
MTVNFKGKVFFYCVPTSTPDKNPYPHLIVGLAEGLKSLGIEFYSDINYWQLSPEKEEYLFRHNPEVTPDDCDIVILEDNWTTALNRPFPKDLFAPNRKHITVYMDAQDGTTTLAWQPEYRQFDFIFRISCNSKLKRPANIHPWSLGLSERMLRELETIPKFAERKQQLVVNYRETVHNKQRLRSRARQDLMPAINSLLHVNTILDTYDNFSREPYHYLQWAQTGRRHSPSYYNSLKESVACACFAGYFVSPIPRDLDSFTSRVLGKLIKNIGWKTNRIVDWDSWRLWESMVAGCVAFNPDFEKYGLVVPVMPENWRHYIGVDFDNIQTTINRLKDEPEILEKISCQGRDWAIEHYSPVPTAIRFLKAIGVS